VTQTQPETGTTRRIFTARRKAVVALSFVALALGLAAAITVPTVSAVARGQVLSYQDARAITCQDQEPGYFPEPENGASSDDTIVRSVALTPELNCELRVLVSNTSSLPAEVTGIAVPGFGWGSANGAFAVDVDGEEFDKIEDYDASLRFAHAYPLAPGETHVFLVHLVSNPSQSCMGEGNTVTHHRAPDILVSALGTESLQAGQPGGFALTGTVDSSTGCG